MIFVLADDQMLSVAESVEKLQGECEGIDVEDGVYRFFDSAGNPLRAVFYEPNQRGSLFGIIPSVVSSMYRLIPDESGKLPRLIDLWETIAGLEKNPHFAMLDDVKRHLTKVSGS